jgi:HK97 family phage major capsid protein
MTDKRPPRDMLVRAVFPGAEVREENGTPRLVGHFAVFNKWTRIDSAFEGTFMERVAPGSFTKAFQPEYRSRVRVTLNHGQDPDLGDKPIASIDVLKEDREGAFYDAELLDGVPPLVVSGLRKGVYGSSFRFRVTREDFNRAAEVSDHNPEGLPERTIREVELYEFGPVTYPAYAGATAAIRSATDDYIRHLIPPDAPSVDAGAVPHLEPERSEPEPEPTPVSDEPGDTTVEYESIEDVRARYDELNETIERLADTFNLPEAEQVTLDASTDERNQLKKKIERWEANQAAIERNAQETRKTETTWRPPEGRNVIVPKTTAELHSPETRAATFDGRMAEYRDDAMHILEKTKFAGSIADQARSEDKLAYMLDHVDSDDGELARRIKFTGSPVYLRAFEKIIKSRGETYSLTPEEARGTALAVGVDGTGGFTVPFAFDPSVIAIGAWTGAINPYRRVCRVVQIVGTDTWNALTATAVVATRTTEAAAATEQGPTFAQPQYIVKRAQGQITASFEMFQDRTDLAAEMASLIQEAKDNEEEASWAVGAGAGSASIGVGPVNGTSGAYTSITTATSVTLAAADFDAVEAALPVRHRFNAQWFFNRANIRRAQALETTGGKLFGGNQYPAVGNPQQDAAGNTGMRLLLYPVNESPSLPTAGTANIVIGTLLNVDSYVIVDRIGMSVQFIPFIFNSSALATGQQALYFMYRNHAAPINVDAGRTLRFLT